MIENGFSRSEYDTCVYVREASDGSLLYLFLYVDDMLVIAKDIFEVKKVKKMLKGKFEMKDLGAAKKILGMEITKDRDKVRLYLSQEKYIKRVFERITLMMLSPLLHL